MTYHGISPSGKGYPESIQSCLKGLDDAFSRDFTADFSEQMSESEVSEQYTLTSLEFKNLLQLTCIVTD
jgi:hypothetical protein